MSLHQALLNMEAAILDAIRAGRDTRKYPHLDRQTLCEMAGKASKMVDAAAPAYVPTTQPDPEQAARIERMANEV